jgi:hypothetical protein
MRSSDRWPARRRSFSDHETRLRTIEQSRRPLASLTVLQGLASLVVAAIYQSGYTDGCVDCATVKNAMTRRPKFH